MEIKVRELEGRTLLASVAAERGHKVILGGKEDTRALARKGILPQGIVHEKSLGFSPVRKRCFRDIIENGNIITSQDEESGLLDESYDKFSKKSYDHDTVEMASFVFCWGEHDRSALINRYPDVAGKFIRSGSPRVDLWRHDFDPYYEKCRDQAIESGKYVLIISNFLTVMNQNPFWNIIAMKREKGMFKSEEYEYEIYNKTVWHLQMVVAYVRAIRRLASQYPGLKFVFRPHPVENVNAWKNMIGDIKNIQIIRSGGASSWIRGAKALIHNSCTTALEAAVRGIPVISFRPIRSCHEHPIPNSMGIEVYTEDELVNVVDKIAIECVDPDSMAQTQSKHEAIHHRFCNLEGRFAADVIVDHWEHVGARLREDKRGYNDIKKFFFKKLIKSSVLKMSSSVRDFVLKPIYRKTIHKTPAPTIHKIPGLSCSEVEYIIKGYESALGRFSDIRVSQLGRRSVLIE
jgi:surface carbohydrate biosynthesis protein